MGVRRTGSAEGLYQTEPRKPDLDKKTVLAALERGVAVVNLGECVCDWTRQAIINEAKRQAGVLEHG